MALGRGSRAVSPAPQRSARAGAAASTGRAGRKQPQARKERTAEELERRSVRRRNLAVIASVVLVAAALLAGPARSYLAQRDQISERRSELAEVEQRNAQLEERLERLDRPDEIQRIARRDYGLVAVGEESYTVLPPATAGLVLPRTWPFDVISGPVERASTGTP